VSRLSIFPDRTSHDDGKPPEPLLVSDDPNTIGKELELRGIGFKQWPMGNRLAEGADQDAILLSFQDEVMRVQTEGGFAKADALRVTPNHPDRASLRQRFLHEHTHAEDEVRVFVEGRGLFCLHIGMEVLAVQCERDDLIRIPAGTRHWFDMGDQPDFCVLRFFGHSDGWEATFTGDAIADRFPRLT